jgi:hypothetical protein
MRSTAALAVLVALAPLPAIGQATFEGAVTYNMAMSAGMALDVVQYVKGDRMRMEMNIAGMGNMVTLVDMSTAKTTVLMPAQKMYMSMDAQQLAQMAGGEANADAKITIEKLGGKETIAGFTCENVKIRVDDMAIDYCATDEIGYFFGGGAPSAGRGGRGGSAGAQLSEATMKAIRKEFPKGFFPLKMSMTANGQQIVMTATKVERKSVPASMFDVPSDYSEMNMGGRGRGGN